MSSVASLRTQIYRALGNGVTREHVLQHKLHVPDDEVWAAAVHDLIKEGLIVVTPHGLERELWPG